MSAPTVSVCIPTYNAGSFLTATIRSVLAQTYTDYEVVIADDGSTDGCLAALDAFPDPRIRRIEPGLRAGAAANWNRSIEAARGRYVKVLHQDDLLEPQCLEHQVAAFEAPGHDDVVLVTARRDLIDDAGRVIVADRGLKGISGRLDAATVARLVVRAGTNPLGEPSIALMRRDTVLACGGFDPREAYLVDLDLDLRLLAHGPLVHLDESVGAFRVSAGSWSGRIGRDQGAQGREFLRRVAAEHPGAVGRTDLAVGLARATALGWVRRALYQRERWRSRHRPTETA